APRIVAAPEGVPQMLVAFAFSLAKPKQIVLVGEKPEAGELLRELNARFLPDKVVLMVDDGAARKRLAGYLSVLETMSQIGGKATAYVCENYTCKIPTSDPRKFAELLQ